MAGSLIAYDMHIISSTDIVKIEKEFADFVSKNNHVVSVSATACVINSAFVSGPILHSLYVLYLGPGLK